MGSDIGSDFDWIWLNIRGAVTDRENRKAGNVQVENKNEKIDWIK